MRPYTNKDVLAIYRQLIKISYELVDKGNRSKGANYLSSAAKWAYQFNFIYSDPSADALIKRISDDEIKHVVIDHSVDNRYVLIDSFCLDNRGLTQQYLRAMIQNGVEVLFVCTASSIEKDSDILFELSNYPKARTLLFVDGRFNSIEMARSITEEIARYAPSHIYLHIAPWDIAALLACSSVTGSTVININLTDHAFWLGSSLIDYNIEFRPYGMTVSLEKRGLKPKQLLQQPFYPVAPIGHPFRGFPIIPDDAVKIFTGGALYKFLGKKDIFFHMMEVLLSISPNVYILVAGFDSSAIFDKKCSVIKGRERILQIGVRDDIDAVFQNCDIYLSTYPTSGGLMCQYAAKYKKPILAYRDVDDMENAVEEMVNHFCNGLKSYTDLNVFVDYARQLIFDKWFRQVEGNSINKGLMTADAFAESFPKLVSSHNKQWNWSRDRINYDAFSNHYLGLENNNGFAATKTLVLERKLHLLINLKGYRIQLLSCVPRIIKDIRFSHLVRIIYKRICTFS